MALPPTKPLLLALAGESWTPPPLWLMRQAGRYLPEYRALRAKAGTFLELCYNPEFAAEASLQPWRRFRPDGVILFSDILVVADALGLAVAFAEGEGPTVEPVRQRAAVPHFEAEAFHRRLASVYETVARLAAALRGTPATLLGFAGAPWTVATYIVEGGPSRDFAATRRFAAEDPDGFASLIDLLVEASAAYLARQAEAGAECLQIFDSWAGALEGEEFERWCIAPTRALIERLRRSGCTAPVIGFPRGAGAGYRRYAAESGASAVSLDERVPLAMARELQGTCPVQGNLDPEVLRTGGRAMEEGARAILAALADGPFIFNLGHGVLKDTDPANVERLAAIVRAWRD